MWHDIYGIKCVDEEDGTIGFLALQKGIWFHIRVHVFLSFGLLSAFSSFWSAASKCTL